MKSDRITYVYVMGSEGGPVKVGISTNPDIRLVQLKAGCCFPITVFFRAPIAERSTAYRIEQTFHRVYREYQRYGEWFNIDAEQAIEGIETAIELEQHFCGQDIQPVDVCLPEDQFGFRQGDRP